MWHRRAKGPPDGPPIFLIFVEKLNCPQSQAYQSISPVGTGLSLTDRALGVSLGTSIGNYSPLIAPQPVKLKMRRSDPCRFESGHRHHVGAKPALLRRLFVPAAKKTSSARSLAHPFQIEPAVLGFDLGMGADWRAAASILLRCIKNPERNRVRDFVLFERARGRGGVSAPLLMCPRAAGVSGWPPGGAFG